MHKNAYFTKFVFSDSLSACATAVLEQYSPNIKLLTTLNKNSIRV